MVLQIDHAIAVSVISRGTLCTSFATLHTKGAVGGGGGSGRYGMVVVVVVVVVVSVLPSVCAIFDSADIRFETGDGRWTCSFWFYASHFGFNTWSWFWFYT